MNAPGDNRASEFDAFAEDYDGALEQGLSVSGENKDYFAQGRIKWVAKCLQRHGVRPSGVMDYGCGTGTSVPLLSGLPGVQSVTGIEVSSASIAVARRLHAATGASFAMPTEFAAHGAVDLAFCNGVFHHIPPPQRADAVAFIHGALRPGGAFAFWENNPWNPGTRYVMSRIPFDRDAVTLSAPMARRLLVGARFEILHTDFLFVFPRLLGWFRRFEPGLVRLPIGAQYLLLCRKR